VELVIAAAEGKNGGKGQESKTGTNAAIRAEAADVIYHLLVLLEATGTPLGEVLKDLERRMGQSGHDEKRSRSEH